MMIVDPNNPQAAAVAVEEEKTPYEEPNRINTVFGSQVVETDLSDPKVQEIMTMPKKELSLEEQLKLSQVGKRTNGHDWKQPKKRASSIVTKLGTNRESYKIKRERQMQIKKAKDLEKELKEEREKQIKEEKRRDQQRRHDRQMARIASGKQPVMDKKRKKILTKKQRMKLNDLRLGTLSNFK